MTTLKDLENLTYTEYISQNNAYKIVQNWDDIFKSLPINRQLKIQGSIDIGQDPLFQLKKIIKTKQNMIHTKYNFSKTLQTYGRLFAQNPSLASLPREMRNSLALGQYYDVDMKNCHPSILSQYCQKNSIRSDILDSYVKDRDIIITKVCDENKVSKDVAKISILSILNGGEGGKLKGSFIESFKIEIKAIHSHVCRLNVDEFKKVQRRKDFNKEGTMMNILLCKLEHMLLMNAVLFMTEQGYNVDVLVFDGFMVRKNKELTNEVLHNLQMYIKDKTAYNMIFIEKIMENSIDLSKYPDTLDEGEVDVSYYKDKELFEKNHLKITHPSLYMTMMDDGSFDMQCEAKIISSYRHLKSTVKDEKGKAMKSSFIISWINDEHIRLYRRLVFIPQPLDYDKRDYNTWRDFEQEKVNLPVGFDMETNIHVQKYKEFISNLFGGVNEYINYFIAWCANIIQNPAIRSSVCLVLYSLEEGAGKNMITKTLELCLGENYVNYITDVSNQLFGKHSSAEMNKLLIVLNEVKGKDTYANTDLFKTRITDDKREVELKGKDTIQITNYSSYILNTNNLNSVNAGDKDRRFCVLDCNNSRISDKKYFKDYEHTINKNPEAIRSIFEYLKTYDIQKIVPDYIFSDARPKTEMYKDLIECNREKEWDFLENLVLKNKNNNDKLKMNTDVLWRNYIVFCQTHHYDISRLSSKRFLYIFNRTIITPLDKNEVYKESITQTRTNSSRGYSFDMDKLRKYFNIEKGSLFEDDDDDDNDVI